jgi:hypothetical protein
MYQLVLEALDGMQIEETDSLNSTKTHGALSPLTKFVEENFGDWVSATFAFLDAFNSVERAVRSEGLLVQPSLLKEVISSEQRQRIAQHVVEFWNSIPRSYEFIFPLPGFTLFDAEIEIARGIIFKNVPQYMVDEASMGLLVSLSSLARAAREDVPIAGLAVIGNGLMSFGDASDPAASGAIRRVKTAIQLGAVEEVFAASATKFKAPQYISHLPREMGETVTLPASFATALARLTVRPIAGPSPHPFLKERLATVGTILARAEEWDPRSRRADEGGAEASQTQFDRHCARIASASEWLFDALNEQPSATTFVQTAIGFEALYGGAKGEPVVATLANRVAYSLGTSPQRRETLIRTFSDFYDTRSAVVHNGATRLTREQQQQLSGAQSILKRALRHELRLVSQGRADIEASGKPAGAAS